MSSFSGVNALRIYSRRLRPQQQQISHHHDNSSTTRLPIISCPHLSHSHSHGQPPNPSSHTQPPSKDASHDKRLSLIGLLLMQAGASACSNPLAKPNEAAQHQEYIKSTDPRRASRFFCIPHHTIRVANSKSRCKVNSSRALSIFCASRQSLPLLGLFIKVAWLSQVARQVS